MIARKINIQKRINRIAFIIRGFLNGEKKKLPYKVKKVFATFCPQKVEIKKII
jgi:hypothetical protein